MNYLIPRWTSIAAHPVYWIEARYLNQKRDLSRLWRYSVNWFLRVFGVVMALWLALILLSDLRADSSLYATYYVNNNSAAYIFWAGVISLLLNLFIDFVCVLVSFNGILKEKMTEHWNLIRLTLVDQKAVIAAKHTLAQVRAWRITIITMSLRATIVVILTLHTAFIPVGYRTTLQDMARMWRRPEDRLEVIAYFIILAVIFLLYVLEPLWRMRTVTAMGTAISAQSKSGNMAILSGFGMVVFMWIGQAAMLGAELFALSLLFRFFLADRYPGDIIMALIYLGTILLIAVSLGLFYTLLARWSLRRAEAAAFSTR